ncbi:MAG: hypothetical protein NTW56_06445 [Alphaproteobacteria bacterium]|nr:hypothetical protein [Alphaproteobacteria bacterium]
MGAHPKPAPDRDAELAAIRAKLARSVEDVKAGRTISGEELPAELRAMLDAPATHGPPRP